MQPTLLIIGFVYPEPNSSAAGSRMLQLIQAFQDNDYRITFATTCKKSDNAFDLKSIGVTVVEIQLNHPSFDVFIKSLNPSIVLFDRFMTEEQFGWRVAEHCPDALRILDTEDLHCLRKARQKAFHSNQTIEGNIFTNETTKREIASIYRSDLSLVISEVEHQILTETFKINVSILCYLPFMTASENCEPQPDCKSYSERRDFVSLGNFLHPPNLDVVRYLKKDIWPCIRKALPEAKLHIYGAYDTPNIKEMHNEKEGFLVHGFVEDAFEVLSTARVLLAPLRFGAGLKGKLIQAMQTGTPCAMSSIAAEGMFGDLPPNGIIENTSDAFVARTVALYSNASEWEAFQQQGFSLLKNRFEKSQHQKRFLNRVKTLQETLGAHRSQNFIGQMLSYHQMQSTKYMARWIEAKNK
jgi:hypothetical protein